MDGEIEESLEVWSWRCARKAARGINLQFPLSIAIQLWHVSEPTDRRESPMRAWPTPRANDSTGAGMHGEGGPDLRTQASLWQTPGTDSFRSRGGDRKGDREDEDDVDELLMSLRDELLDQLPLLKEIREHFDEVEEADYKEIIADQDRFRDTESDTQSIDYGFKHISHYLP